MTREEIAKSLKPLEWVDDEDYSGRPIISADLLAKSAYIKERAGGLVTLMFGYDDGEKIEVIKTYGGISMERAKSIAREWQIDEMCNYFQMND